MKLKKIKIFKKSIIINKNNKIRKKIINYKNNIKKLFYAKK